MAVPTSFLDLSISLEKIQKIFSKAQGFLQNPQIQKFQNLNSAAFLFFEPSTRTRMSFESAADRLNIPKILLDGGMSSSLEKGESIEDSILNVCAMEPCLAVIRCPDSVNLTELAHRTQIPFLNAGWGMKGHPSQALLDIFTLNQHWQNINGRKILFLGDIIHSRVVSSHREILTRMGAEIGFCAPNYLMPTDSNETKFTELKEALTWADAVVCLRTQFERHSSLVPLGDGGEIRKYKEFYTLKQQSLQYLRPESLILHPGPIHHDLDMESSVLLDPRCCVLEQVKYGVYIRQALLALTLESDL